MPILIPFIMEKDKNAKEGFFTSAVFSMGRLLIYFSIGLAVFAVGSAVTEDTPGAWLTGAVVILGIVVILYGAWIVFKLPRIKWCPRTIARNFRPVFSVILGLLIGSFFCPLLWIALVSATLTRDMLTLVLSVFAFWLGSSVTIITAGTVSGELGGRWGKKMGKEQLREIMGMVLIMVGIMYLVNGLIL
jgi:sulfite exporter TauE/SafE